MTEHYPDFLNEEDVAGKGGQNLARRLFPDLQDTIAVRRVVDAAPEEVLSAMQGVFPGEPCRLTLVEERGDPLSGGLLVFDIQGFGAAFPRGLAREAAWSAVRQVFASVKLIEGAAPSCEMTLRGPIAW